MHSGVGKVSFCADLSCKLYPTAEPDPAKYTTDGPIPTEYPTDTSGNKGKMDRNGYFSVILQRNASFSPLKRKKVAAVS